MPRQSPLDDPQGLYEEHRHLAQSLAEFRRVLARKHVGQGTVVAYLVELKEHVELHFTHEEDDGYFSDALLEAPRLDVRAAGLLQQHPEFLQCLDCMRASAEDGDGADAWWMDIAAQFDDFTQRFRQHEAAENTLLLEAYTEDIGAED